MVEDLLARLEKIEGEHPRNPDGPEAAAEIRRLKQELATARDQAARFVETLLWTRQPGMERVVLAIAAKTIRRGRPLTEAEKLLMLSHHMKEAGEVPAEAPKPAAARSLPQRLRQGGPLRRALGL